MTERQSHNANAGAREKFLSLEILYRDLMRGLNVHECLVLNFIWMRTCFWGKNREFIKTKHFIEGIPGIIAGLPLSKPAILRATKSLTEKNLIIKETQIYGCWFEIVFTPKESNVIMLRQPKNKRSGTNSGLKNPKGGEYLIDTTRYPIDTTYKLDNIKLGHKEKNSESLLSQMKEDRNLKKEKKQEEFLELEKSIQRASDNSKRIRERKIERAKKSETINSLKLLWKDLTLKTFPEMPYADWTGIQCKKIKDFKNAYLADNERVWPFLEFCIANWSRIAKLRFGWLTDVKPPDYPDIDFLIGFKKFFIQAYADKEFFERQIGATPKEREIRKLKRMGYTDEQAEKIYLEQLEKSAATKRVSEKAEKAQAELARSRIHSKSRQKDLEKELRRQKLENARLHEELQKKRKKEKLHPAANSIKPEKEIRYDADGYAIFEE